MKNLIKIFIFFLLAFFALALISCSSSKSVSSETAATESMTALEIAKDSVHSNLDLQTSTSGYLEISDLSILFYPPSEILTPPVPEDSVADNPLVLPSTQKPKILYPALLNIGRLSAGSASNTMLKESNDSVGLKASDISQDQSTKDSEQRIRDPTKPSWPVMLSLFIALLIIIYTGFMLYRSNRL